MGLCVVPRNACANFEVCQRDLRMQRLLLQRVAPCASWNKLWPTPSMMVIRQRGGCSSSCAAMPRQRAYLLRDCNTQSVHPDQSHIENFFGLSLDNLCRSRSLWVCLNEVGVVLQSSTPASTDQGFLGRVALVKFSDDSVYSPAYAEELAFATCLLTADVGTVE